MNWLLQAQEATADDGVAQAYFVRQKRWTASYPETTGYIIPTCFAYAHFTGKKKFAQRALRMADWEVQIQLPEGAIQASTIDAAQAVPTIFNTGMVIFGWVRAYDETHQKVYLNAAAKAADWLIAVQDPDGAWRKFGSTVTVHALNTYNTRVAWALLEVYRVTNAIIYLEAAQKNLNWALSQQQPNGWLRNNCLLDNRQPYTHTMAYAMRGFLEAEPYFNERRYLQAAQKIFAGLEPSIQKDGFLAGRFDQNWRPTVSYCCLTGNAQLALNAFRLFELTGDKHYIVIAQKLLNFVLKTQDLKTSDHNLRGGIAGSYPLSGKYHPYQYPNWAAKFTADALLQSLKLQREEDARPATISYRENHEIFVG